MKFLRSNVLAAAVLAAGLLAVGSAATSVVLITQIRGDAASATGSVAVTTPNGTRAAWAKLGSGLSLQNGVLSDTAVAGPQMAAEVPAGALDGTNAVFTLTNAPIASSQLVFRNGLALFPAAGDYSIAGNTITFNAGAVPQPGDALVVVYLH